MMLSPTYSTPWPLSSSSSSSPKHLSSHEDSAFHDEDNLVESLYSTPIYNEHNMDDFEFERRLRITQADFERDPDIRKRFMQTHVSCIHKDTGCKWQGPLSLLQSHLTTCTRAGVTCPADCGAQHIPPNMLRDHVRTTCPRRRIECAKCKQSMIAEEKERHKCGFESLKCDLGCGQEIQRNRMKAHQANYCSRRVLECQYCKNKVIAEEMISHLKLLCPKSKVKCPTPRCSLSAELSRDELEKHLRDECDGDLDLNDDNANNNSSNKLLSCEYEEAGCRFRASHKSEMEEHLADFAHTHLRLMRDLHRKSQNTITKLTTELERAHTSYNGVMIWKVRELTSKMAEAKNSSGGLELVSLPFYTSHQAGYKLQASLFLNGNGAGQNSHLSIYIKLLPGDYDSILKWPFRHTVSFTLLDQNMNRHEACNIVESFIPDPEWPNFKRPSKSVDALGFGFPRFVPHSMLFNLRQYVKDDAIFIKIRVDPARNVAV